jgi:acetylornithine deacetylase/succinyl-diaminopimelate desuccinylase-like protein
MFAPVAQILDDLFAYIRFASVSGDPAYRSEVEACADWLTERFARAGLDAKKMPTAGHPIVLARSSPRENLKTVLIYGHYDVQPPDPLDLWDSPPFEPTLKNDHVFARGSADNKGQLLPHLFGVEQAIRENRLPVNVIFLVEGEEECGSANLDIFLQEHRETLKADIAVISDSGMIAPGVPTLVYGTRGLVCLEVQIEGPNVDLHSGIFGGLVANPANVLARLITSLQGEDGKITVPGFYDRVQPIQPWERELWAGLPRTDQDWLDAAGSPKLCGEPEFSSLERMWARPTMDINGLVSGYAGEGPKTIIPSKASAKISFRLVPDQDPVEIRELVNQHLLKHCPSSVKLRIIDQHQGNPYLVRTDSSFALAARKALEATFKKPVALVRGGGTLPILQSLKDILGIDTLLAGLEWMDCRAHSPNENFPVENLYLGMAMNQNLLAEIAATEKE